MILDFQWFSLIAFVIILSIVIVKHRKKLELQKLLFPVLYAGLYRTNFGLKFINKISKKYKEWIKLLGYIGIGVGFIGMVVIVVSIIQAAIIALVKPATQAGVALVLPQTNIPGIGFLPFWYWIIALFVLVVIHEFAHGIVAKAHGVKIKNSGLGFFAIIVPLIPIAFVEPEEKEMNKKEDVVQYSIFAAGPFANILTALIILLVFLFVFTPIDNKLTEPTGFTFDKIEGYPSAVLPENIIINKMNGESVNTVQQFIDGMIRVDVGKTITLGNNEEEYELTTTASPDTGKAFIGISNIKNELKVKEGVSKIGYGIYAWVRGLLKWIGLLSFFIGLANLLPIGPIDGGRMVKTASEKLYKNKTKANKSWVMISMLILLLLLISLILPWLKGLI